MVYAELLTVSMPTINSYPEGRLPQSVFQAGLAAAFGGPVD
jgi:hypothetical protein